MDKEIMESAAEEWLNELINELPPNELENLQLALNVIDEMSPKVQSVFEFIYEFKKEWGKLPSSF